MSDHDLLSPTVAAVLSGNTTASAGDDALPGQSQPISAPARQSTAAAAAAARVTTPLSPTAVAAANASAAAAGGTPRTSGGPAVVSTPPLSMSAGGAGAGTASLNSRKRPTTAGPNRDLNALTASIKSHNAKLAADKVKSGNMFDGVDDVSVPSTANNSTAPASTSTAATGPASNTSIASPGSSTVTTPDGQRPSITTPTAAAAAAAAAKSPQAIIIRKSVTSPSNAAPTAALPTTYTGPTTPTGAGAGTGTGARSSLGGVVPGSGVSPGGFTITTTPSTHPQPIDRRPPPRPSADFGSPPPNNTSPHAFTLKPSGGGSGGAGTGALPVPGGGHRPSTLDIGLSSTVTRIIGGQSHNPVLGVGMSPAQHSRRGSDGILPDGFGASRNTTPGGTLNRRPPQAIDTEALLSPPPNPSSARRPTPHLQPLGTSPGGTASTRGHRPSASFGDLPPMPELAATSGGGMGEHSNRAMSPRTLAVPGGGGGGAAGGPAIGTPSPGGGGLRSLRATNNASADISIPIPGIHSTRPTTGGMGGKTLDAPIPNLVLPPEPEKHQESFPYLWLMLQLVVLGLGIAGDVYTAVNVDVPALGSEASWSTKLAWALQAAFLLGMAVTLVSLCIFKSPYNSWTAVLWQLSLSFFVVSAAIITSQQNLWNLDLIIPYSDAPHFAVQLWWLGIIVFYVMFTVMTARAPHNIPPISADTIEKGVLVRQLRETRGALVSTRGILESVRPGLLAASGGGGAANMFPDASGAGSPGGAGDETATKRTRRASGLGSRRPGSSHDASQFMAATASRRTKSGDQRGLISPQRGADELAGELKGSMG